MKRDLVRKLLLYIVDQLQDMEAPISTIRLVKMLYLIDLEYYKRQRTTLTDIDWIRYYYGPYFMALPGIIDSLGVGLEKGEVLTERGRGFTFRSLDEQEISDITKDFATQGLIDRIIKRWALEDLDDLLGFVYSTLQVKYSQFNRALEFSIPTWAMELESEFQLLDAASDWDHKNLEPSLKE